MHQYHVFFIGFNPRVSILNRNPFLKKSWCFSDNRSKWIQDYWSLHNFQHVCAFILTNSGLFGTHVVGFMFDVLGVPSFLCVWSILFKNFFSLCFFGCLIYFLALCFTIVFRSNQNFLFGLWLNKKFRINPIGSYKKKMGQRVFGLP